MSFYVSLEIQYWKNLSVYPKQNLMMRYYFYLIQTCISYYTITCIGRKLQYKRDVWRCVIATSRTIWRKRHWWLPGSVQIVQQMEIRVTLFSRIYIDCAICIALYFVVVRTDWRRKTNYQWMYCTSIVYVYTKISFCSVQTIYGSSLCDHFICATFSYQLLFPNYT